MHADKMQFKIAGMDCAEEVSVLKKELGPIVGGDGNLSFDVLNEILTVTCCSIDVPPETIQTAVARTGMAAVVWLNGPKPVHSQTFFQEWGRTLLTAISGLLTLLGFATHLVMTQSIRDAIGSEGMGLTHQIPLPVRILYGLAILTGAWFVLPRAFLALRRLQPDMNLLMTISVVGAAAIGDWLEASTVAFLFSVSI